VIVDRALRAFLFSGAEAVGTLLRWGAQRNLDAPADEPREAPDAPSDERIEAVSLALKAVVVDDLDGEALPEDHRQTVRFGLDGQNYEIYLDAEQAGELRSTLRRYIDAGRRIGAQPPAPATIGSGRPRRSITTTQQNNTAAIRAWARAHGHPVSDRGRIPAAVLRAYEAAPSESRRTG
jgi:hypothetical protein